MIISHDLKYMFIHLPKTGGTSIRKTMIHNDIFRVNTKGQCYKNKTTIADCNDPKVDTNIWSHSSLRDGVNYLKNKGYQPDEYFKFIFIRNPWDRMVSSYEYNIHYMFLNIKNFTWVHNTVGIKHRLYRPHCVDLGRGPCEMQVRSFQGADAMFGRNAAIEMSDRIKN